jgi:hypothetical protein
MKLTKEEKDEFMSKYTEDETSPEVLNYLKRHFQTYKIDILTLNEPEVMISIDGKSYFVRSNKKRSFSKKSQNLYPFLSHSQNQACNSNHHPLLYVAIKF